MMQKYKTLLFDADNTLLDFNRAEREAVIDSLSHYGIQATDEVIRTYSRVNDEHWKMLERGEILKDVLYYARWQAFADIYGFELDAKKISDLYLEKLSQKAYEIEGAEQICRKLSEYCRMYIITNGNKMVQDGRMGRVSLSSYFSDRFISEVIGHEKPSIEFFNAVISSIPDFDPVSTLVIGDSLTSDIQGGINAGLDTCWYNPNGKPAPDTMKITYTISKLIELEEIVL